MFFVWPFIRMCKSGRWSLQFGGIQMSVSGCCSLTRPRDDAAALKWKHREKWFWLMSWCTLSKTFAGFDVAEFRSRWIQSFCLENAGLMILTHDARWAKLSLDSMLLNSGLAGFNHFVSTMQVFGLFRCRMWSWCSFLGSSVSRWVGV